MKRFNRFSSEDGLSLTEIIIAMGITSLVLLGGSAVYNHLMKETSKETTKMDALSEFNLLTKDLIVFAEGAGISTSYLNLPVKVKNCNDSEPCVRKLVHENFVNADSADLPQSLNDLTCIQFFKDGLPTTEGKKAYPGKSFTDKVYEIKDISLSANPNAELYTTWILKDDNSPPVIMMKNKEGNHSFNYLRGANVEKSREGNSNDVEHAFFESDLSASEAKALIGHPFIVYNSLYINHYVVQYAEDIVSCKEEPDSCKKFIKDLSSPHPFPTNAQLSAQTKTTYPDKVFAIKFSEIDLSSPFFEEIQHKQALPTSCKSGWGEGRQSSSKYFFPTFTYSVWQDDSDGKADLGGPSQLNLVHMGHYYTIRGINNNEKGLLIALPIDIVSYRVQKDDSGKSYRLVTDFWHATHSKQKVKIHHLTGPFIVARKLGRPEISIWYNPLKTKPKE